MNNMPNGCQQSIKNKLQKRKETSRQRNANKKKKSSNTNEELIECYDNYVHQLSNTDSMDHKRRIRLSRNDKKEWSFRWLMQVIEDAVDNGLKMAWSFSKKSLNQVVLVRKFKKDKKVILQEKENINNSQVFAELLEKILH